MGASICSVLKGFGEGRAGRQSILGAQPTVYAKSAGQKEVPAIRLNSYKTERNKTDQIFMRLSPCPPKN